MEKQEEKTYPKHERVPVKRLVSKRDIGIEAFELADGNLMMEATFMDPYHLLRLNLIINPATKTIVHARSEFTNHPHGACPLAELKAKQLIGLKIERGIAKLVLQKIGGSEGCVHLRELAMDTINFAATTLIGYDEGFGLMSRDFNLLEESKRMELSQHLLKGSCHIYK